MGDSQATRQGQRSRDRSQSHSVTPTGGWQRIGGLLVVIAIGVETLSAVTAEALSHAPSADHGDRAQLNTQLRPLMDQHAVPGVQLVEIHDGVASATLAIGASDGDIPVLASSVFEAASLGKPLFAYLVLRLAQRGELSLDETLWSIEPIDGADDPALRVVTVAQALNHTSGLGNGLYLGPGTAVEGRPGERWRYSGAAYFWLQRALERRTGQSLDALAEEWVFEPLGMSRTRFSWRGDMREHAATGHDEAGSAQPKWQPSHAVAPSSLHTTADDYARFLSELVRLYRAGDPDDRALASLLFSPSVDTPHGVSWSLALGLVEQQDGTLRAFHWGANPHFRAFFIIDPERGDGLVMLSNATQGLELADELCDWTFGSCTRLFGFPLLHPTD
jgi:CubicO group peptidase (beta-lactamase class C family)